MFEEVRTRRLVGTKPLLRDADELHPICADPRVARWVWPQPLSLAQTRAMLVRDMDHWKRRRFGRWVLREAGAVVGLAGLLADEEEVELAWFIASDRWRHGLATEIAHAAVAHAFTGLGLPSVTAKTDVENGASRRVMERLGMTYAGELTHAGIPHVRYRLTNAAS